MSSDSTLDAFIGLEGELNRASFLEWLKKQTGTPIIYNGRVTGYIYHHPTLKKIYVTYRNKDNFLYHKWQSIGISRIIISRLINQNVNKIVIHIKDDDSIYICSPILFIKEGKTLWFRDESDSQLHVNIKLLNRL